MMNTMERLSDMLHFVGKSPQAHLASYLAHLLSALFDIDPELIESNLLSNAKIVLHDVHLKPQGLGSFVTLIGHVQEMGLTWSWGAAADGSTTFVHETLLTIRGAHIRLQRANPEQQQHQREQYQEQREQHSLQSKYTEHSTHNSDDEDDERSFHDEIGEFIDHHVQQIIDALRLELFDLEFIIDLDPSLQEARRLLGVTIKSAKLYPTERGREKQDQNKHQDGEEKVDQVPHLAFEQRLCVNGLSAHVVQVDENNEMICPSQSMVEPFHYHVTVRQVSGKRFVGGYSTGLEIVGSPLPFVSAARKSKDIVIHAGTLQTETLTTILEFLLRRGLEKGKHQRENDDDTPSMKRPMPWVRTSILLPLPPVNFQFPNDSTVRVPNCSFLFLTDRTALLFYGSKGIFLDGLPILQLGNGMRWRLDILNREFALDLGDVLATDVFYDTRRTLEEEWSRDPPETLATFQWQWKEIRKLIQGIQEFILSIQRGRCVD